MNEISLYDLMAQDLTVWIAKNKKFGFDLCIEGDDPTERIETVSYTHLTLPTTSRV